jgi:hypothetical protein
LVSPVPDYRAFAGRLLREFELQKAAASDSAATTSSVEPANAEDAPR